MATKRQYETLSWFPETEAAALRLVLDNDKSGIDTLPAWVRFRVEEAVKTLDECADRLEALERYVELVTAAESEAFGELCKATAAEVEGKA